PRNGKNTMSEIQRSRAQREAGEARMEVIAQRSITRTATASQCRTFAVIVVGALRGKGWGQEPSRWWADHAPGTVPARRPSWPRRAMGRAPRDGGTRPMEDSSCGPRPALAEPGRGRLTAARWRA